MSFDLIKNAAGLLFLALLLWFYVVSLESPGRRYVVLSCVMVLLCGLTHVLDFGMALLFLLLMLVLGLRDRLVLRRTLPPLAVGLLLLVLGFLYYPVMGGDPYKGLSFLVELLGGGSSGRVGVHAGVWGSLSRVLYPLLAGVAGVLASTRLRGVRGKVLLALSLVLVALNLPFIPGEFLWRFNLMSAILLPLVIGVSLGLIRDNRAILVVALILAGFTLSRFTVQLQQISPSIPVGEYEEIKHLAEKTPPGTIMLVPYVRLKYWIETVYPSTARKPNEIPPRTPVLLVYDLIMPKRHHTPPVPPVAKLFYRGDYITAYMLPSRKCEQPYWNS